MDGAVEGRVVRILRRLRRPLLNIPFHLDACVSTLTLLLLQSTQVFTAHDEKYVLRPFWPFPSRNFADVFP